VDEHRMLTLTTRRAAFVAGVVTVAASMRG
jgi:hypothetical protein